MGHPTGCRRLICELTLTSPHLIGDTMTTTPTLVEFDRIASGLYRTRETYGVTEWWAEVTRVDSDWLLTTTTFRRLQTRQHFRTLADAQRAARAEFYAIETGAATR